MRLWLCWILGMVGCVNDSPWVDATLVGGLITIDAEVDGAPVRCFVDTGASLSILHTDLGITMVPILSLGDREDELEGVSDPSIDPFFDGLSDLVGPVDCLLGWPAFEDYAFTVDYARARARLANSGPRGSRIDDADLGAAVEFPFRSTTLVPTVMAEVHGQTFRAVLDTGASVAYLRPEVLVELDDPPSTEAVQVFTPDGVLSADSGVLDEVTLGSFDHNEVAFVSYPSLQIDALGNSGVFVDGILGATSLIRGAVTFDGRRGVTLQPYDGATVDSLLEEHDSFLRTRSPDAMNPTPWRIPGAPVAPIGRRPHDAG